MEVTKHHKHLGLLAFVAATVLSASMYVWTSPQARDGLSLVESLKSPVVSFSLKQSADASGTQHQSALNGRVVGLSMVGSNIRP